MLLCVNVHMFHPCTIMSLSVFQPSCSCAQSIDSHSLNDNAKHSSIPDCAVNPARWSGRYRAPRRHRTSFIFEGRFWIMTKAQVALFPPALFAALHGLTDGQNVGSKSVASSTKTRIAKTGVRFVWKRKNESWNPRGLARLRAMPDASQ
jgi:hypothetical protein